MVSGSAAPGSRVRRVGGERGRIGPLLAAALVASNLIGSGIFLLPATLASIGSSSILGWLGAAFGAMTLAFCFALLARLRPAEETLIDYPARAFHPFAGFLAWAGYWGANVVGNVGVLIAAVGYGSALFGVKMGRVGETALLVCFIWGLSLLAVIGPRMVGRFAAATLVIGLLPIALATGLGFWRFDPGLFAESWNLTAMPLNAALPPVVLTIFWAFLGVESANAVAAVVRDPARNVPIAAVGGVAFSAIVYALATVALFGLIPAAALSQSSAPFADAVRGVLGSGAGAIVAFAALAKTLGCAGGWVLVTAEAGRAGAAQGFLPKALSEVDPGRRPVRDTLLVAALMTLAALATASPTLNEQFLIIVDFTVLLFLGVYLLCALALIRFAGAAADRRLRRRGQIAGAAGALFCVIVASAWFLL